MKHHRANLLARTRPLRTGAGITATEQRRVSSIPSCSLIARSSLHNTHTARLLEVSLIGWISLNRLARPVAATKVEDTAAKGGRISFRTTARFLRGLSESFPAASFDIVGQALCCEFVVRVVFAAFNGIEAGADLCAELCLSFVSIFEESKAFSNDLARGLIHARLQFLIYEFFQFRG